MKKNQARNRFSIRTLYDETHTLSDETQFIINPMGSEYYNQDILRENWMGKLLSSSMYIYAYFSLSQYLVHSN